MRHNGVITMTQDGHARLSDAIESEWGEGDPYEGPNAFHDPVAYRVARIALRETPIGSIYLSRSLVFHPDDEPTLTHSERVALMVEYFGLERYF